ncbi:hypothetical protein [Roseibium sp. RKSG952]|uniref:hypothetical protein n=1 Tax=Roseibium sp. RKSG952 TaxID=2529384 RepID=UPI0012BBC5EC|nr:hypothetical protein [Roseibium sp. RKSG952]MTH96374.1 hypothetical protein [Roseibium sp. RKSG952]
MPFPDNKPDLDQLSGMTPAGIADLPTRHLARLQDDLSAEISRLRQLKTRFDSALTLRYADRALGERQRLRKDTGTVRFDDDGMTVVADLPKRVDWDQKKLALLAERIRLEGGNPGEYVDQTYKVPERKYVAWPAHIRSAFEDARTVGTGTLKIALVDGKAAGTVSAHPEVPA